MNLKSYDFVRREVRIYPIQNRKCSILYFHFDLIDKNFIFINFISKVNHLSYLSLMNVIEILPIYNSNKCNYFRKVFMNLYYYLTIESFTCD